MESRNGLLGQRCGIWRSLRDGDFEEEDVWAVLRDKTDHSSFNSNSKVTKSNKEPSSVTAPKHVPTASRRIARASGGSCGSSSSSSCSAGNSISEPKITQQSAPVNIPDWSNIQKHKSKKAHENHDYDDDSDGKVDFNNDDDDNDDDDDDKLPPHEFIARRLARSQISSFSVFEGVGRTLKGRDLSKVRNAVLSKTGFLESL